MVLYEINRTLELLGYNNDISLVDSVNDGAILLRVTIPHEMNHTLTHDACDSLRKLTNLNIHSVYTYIHSDSDGSRKTKTYIQLPIRNRLDVLPLVAQVAEWRESYLVNQNRFQDEDMYIQTNALESNNATGLMLNLLYAYIEPIARPYNFHAQIENHTAIVRDGTIITNQGSFMEITWSTYTPDGVPYYFVITVQNYRNAAIKLPTVAFRDGRIMLHTDTYGDRILTRGEVNTICHEADLFNYDDPKPRTEKMEIISKVLCDIYLSHVEATRSQGVTADDITPTNN